MERSLRLHLGAGHYWWPGFVNLDAEADLKALPYENVDEIHAIHLFEHLPRLEVSEYLREWRRVLKDDGKLILELPSLDKMAQLIVNGERNQRLTLLGIFGDPRDWDGRPLMRHEWAWTDVEILDVLAQNGFEAKVVEPVFHIPQRDMRVEATKAMFHVEHHKIEETL